jgi:hypothetical protein
MLLIRAIYSISRYTGTHWGEVDSQIFNITELKGKNKPFDTHTNANPPKPSLQYKVSLNFK